MIPLGKRKNRVVFAFGDPAGAKALIAYYLQEKEAFKEGMLLSDRYHSFYANMGVEVKVCKRDNIKVLLDNFKPDIICTGTSVPEGIELECLRYGMSKSEIFTSTFVDHWTNIKLRFLSNHGLIFPDRICVIDELAKQKCLDESIPKEKISIIGNPYYEYLKHWKPSISRIDLFAELGLLVQNKYVLYAPEPLSTFGLEKKYGFDEIDGLNLLSTIFSGEIIHANIFLVIKCHANQNIDLIYRWLQEQKNQVRHRVVIVKDFEINALIYYSEKVLGFFSNSLLEAQNMNKNVGRILTLLKDFSLDPIAELQVGRSLLSVEELTEFISENNGI